MIACEEASECCTGDGRGRNCDAGSDDVDDLGDNLTEVLVCFSDPARPKQNVSSAPRPRPFPSGIPYFGGGY
jgi:hypothetical protein